MFLALISLSLFRTLVVSYGSSRKELQDLAARIIFVTCSATGCKRNWSTFQRIHSKKRKRLEAQRLNASVFVKYLLTLELRQKKREENGDAYDLICPSDMESDNNWTSRQLMEGHEKLLRS